jgi:hypothetical protein
MSEETTLARRVADIRSRLSEHHDEVGELLFVRIICDSCGRERTFYPQLFDPVLIERSFAGWAIDDDPPYHDLCPKCR